ncbi:MAG: hypothetical protein AAF694_21360 [Bacteroidota bacterium]
MKKSQLTETQLKHLKHFNLILECDGWVDYLSVEDQFEAGKDMNPEGVMSIREESLILEAQFHVPVQMLSLSISDKRLRQKVDIFFLYDQQPEHILEWIVSVRAELNIHTYRTLLNQHKDICKTIFLAESNAEHVELKPHTT